MTWLLLVYSLYAGHEAEFLQYGERHVCQAAALGAREFLDSFAEVECLPADGWAYWTMREPTWP